MTTTTTTTTKEYLQYHNYITLMWWGMGGVLFQGGKQVSTGPQCKVGICKNLREGKLSGREENFQEGGKLSGRGQTFRKGGKLSGRGASFQEGGQAFRKGANFQEGGKLSGRLFNQILIYQGLTKKIGSKKC